eukprot:scaffold221372_cov16-Prasinocladus_malaysianus.AAC.2
MAMDRLCQGRNQRLPRVLRVDEDVEKIDRVGKLKVVAGDEELWDLEDCVSLEVLSRVRREVRLGLRRGKWGFLPYSRRPQGMRLSQRGYIGEIFLATKSTRAGFALRGG